MASNVVAAWDLWVLAGGQDERWSALMLSTDNRRVLIQSQRAEGPGGSEEFLARIGLLYRLAVERGLRQRWPRFPTFEFLARTARGSNGAVAQAVPQGADQVRGPGTTLLHMEELSVWEQAQDSCEAAIPALNPFGHLVAVATPRVDSYASRIRKGEFSMYGGFGELPATRRLPLFRAGDWAILEIRGERDVPDYDVSAFRGMSVQKHRAEVLGDWTASGGKVVYEEYGDIHEPNAPLPFDPKRDLVCGWDLPAATGGTPAFIASQMSGAGQWCLYGSVLPGVDESPGMWEFAERVAEWLTEKFARPAGIRLEDLKLVHYGDPAGNQKALAGGKAKEIRSAYEIIRNGDRIEVGLDDYTRQPLFQERPGRGWIIQPGEISLRKRLECVKQRLMLNVRGAPALVVAPSATFIREGFRGGYCYQQRQDGRYELDPAKNRYSHVFNAIEYAASKLFLQHPESDPVMDALRAQRQFAPATRTVGAGRRGR